MTSRELIAWSRLYERRSQRTSSLALALVAGVGIAGWVQWRETASVVGASHAWLAATVVAFALAFLRVPFHLYWRADAALLAQLPIEGGPLFDAALVRCVRAAAATTLAAVVGSAPLAHDSPELAARQLAVAVSLGLAAARFFPTVAILAHAPVALLPRARA